MTNSASRVSENAAKFLAVANVPGPLATALQAAGASPGVEALVAIAKAHGFSVTAAEVASLAAAEPTADLSDAALAGVSGGIRVGGPGPAGGVIGGGSNSTGGGAGTP